ncbi:MAG: recombinase family protein [Firmicutes bacterium]|nr:recombinase family protein [Bacillota bacterium]
MDKIKKAVIYARYSSSSQSEQSLEGQIRVCTEYAQKNNILIIETYTDSAKTGTTDNRPAFQQMITDSEKKNFELVLVYKLDRFSRDRFDSAIYKKALRNNGVKVFSVIEQISDTPEGVILESVLEGYNQYFSLELAQKVKRGLKETALKAKFTGGKPPTGYRITADKHFEVDETNAPAIRYIFQSYAEGVSYQQMMKWLREHGYKNSYKKPFSEKSIMEILRNEKYAGTYVFNGSEHIRIENAIPAIIDKTLFETVQARILANKKRPGQYKAKQEYLLSGKIRCGECGAAMVGSGHKNLAYYVCNGKKRYGECKKSNVKKFEIENMALTETMTLLAQDNLMEVISESLHKTISTADDPVVETAALQSQLSEINRQLENIATAIAEGLTTPTTKNKLWALEEEKAEIELQLLRISAKQPIEITKDMIFFWLTEFTGGDINDVGFRKKLIFAFVNRVFLYDDKLAVVYNPPQVAESVEQITLGKVNHAIDNLVGGGLDLESHAAEEGKSRKLRYSRLTYS